jgi:hypothetical protein
MSWKTTGASFPSQKKGDGPDTGLPRSAMLLLLRSMQLLTAKTRART